MGLYEFCIEMNAGERCLKINRSERVIMFKFHHNTGASPRLPYKNGDLAVPASDKIREIFNKADGKRQIGLSEIGPFLSRIWNATALEGAVSRTIAAAEKHPTDAAHIAAKLAEIAEICGDGKVVVSAAEASFFYGKPEYSLAVLSEIAFLAGEHRGECEKISTYALNWGSPNTVKTVEKLLDLVERDEEDLKSLECGEEAIRIIEETPISHHKERISYYFDLLGHRHKEALDVAVRCAKLCLQHPHGHLLAEAVLEKVSSMYLGSNGFSVGFEYEIHGARAEKKEAERHSGLFEDIGYFTDQARVEGLCKVVEKYPYPIGSVVAAGLVEVALWRSPGYLKRIERFLSEGRVACKLNRINEKFGERTPEDAAELVRELVYITTRQIEKGSSLKTVIYAARDVLEASDEKNALERMNFRVRMLEKSGL